VTSAVQDPIDLLRTAWRSSSSGAPTSSPSSPCTARQGGRGGYDHDTLAALIASACQAVSDIAHALRRMVRAAANAARPTLHARYCVPGQRRQTG
jgi:DnaK suppressor protein